MRKLSDTLDRMLAFRALYWEPEIYAAPHPLSDLNEFGINPGALRAKTYVPADLPTKAPLVVALHGCTQAAAGYNRGSGWSRLADQYGFAVLFPEQQRVNNPNLCFNWFRDLDTRRDAGEALSIRQMVEKVVTREGLDRRRIYVVGLSAGGAMVSALLATYPDVFAGGAIIAGLAYGSARTIPQAFDRMRGHGAPSEEELQALVRDASRHEGPWPIVSIWHGSDDRTVEASNMETIVDQWREVHRLPKRPNHIDVVDGYPHRVWRNHEGRDCIEAYAIAGMGHGTPLDTLRGDRYGAIGAYMLEAGISSTFHIARFWGLTKQRGSGDARPLALARRCAKRGRTQAPPSS